MKHINFIIFLISLMMLAGCGQTTLSSEEIQENIEDVHNKNLEIVDLMQSNESTAAKELVIESSELVVVLQEENNVDTDSEESLSADYLNYLLSVNSYYHTLNELLAEEDQHAELIFSTEEWLIAQEEISQSLSSLLNNNRDLINVENIHQESVNKESYFEGLNVILTHFFAITEHQDSGAESRKYNENNLMWNEVNDIRNNLLKETQDLDFVYDLLANISEFGAIAYAIDIDDWDTITNDLAGDAGINSGQILENYYSGEFPEALNIYFSEQSETPTEQEGVDLAENLEDEPTEQEDQSQMFSQDEWWEVPGEWKLKINDVYTTENRNQFSDQNPEQVIIIDYTYENLGYEGSVQDLYLSPNTVIDSEGILADTYPTTGITGPRASPIGATMESAEVSYGLSNAGGEIQIMFDQYDTSSSKHTGVFSVEVE